MNSEDINIAQRAFGFSQQAFENGNYELAQTYMLNAITHYSDLKYLSSYPTIIKKLSHSDRNIYIEQAINLYSIALFNNPPEDVSQIMSLIEELKEYIVEEATSNNFSTDDNDDVENNIFVGFETEAPKYCWNKLIESGKIEDINVLSEKVDFLNDVIQASEEVPLYSLSEAQRELLQKSPQVLQETKTFIEYVGIRKSVEQYLDEAKIEIRKANYDSQYVVCRLQQVSTLLAQLWLFDVNSIIGREKYSEQLRKLQKSCTELEKEFLEKESEPLCMTIKNEISFEIARTEKYSNAKFTAMIDILQKRYGEISAKISEIPLKSKILEMQRELQKLAETINELSKKRYAAYQKKCAKICRAAIQNFEDITWVWEKDAEEILRKNPLHTINEALISPETASILQMTKQILEDKLSKLNKADFAVKCVEADKMKLEEF